MRIECDRYILWCGPEAGWNAVQRVRLRPDEVEQTVEEVRALLRARGRSRTEWEISGSAEPRDLLKCLRALGFRPHDEPYIVPMVLVEEPPQGPPEIVVRVARSPDEYSAALAVMHEAFGGSPASAEERARFEDRWRDYVPTRAETYVAWIGDEVVGAATGSYTDAGVALNAGAVLAHVRGRGAYRALVRARWDEAVRRGTPALYTQAAPMSRPILKRLGFVEIGEIHVLMDEF
jgi:GNAT superfamily N-acetyltransferase